jgi:hypothetical protein
VARENTVHHLAPLVLASDIKLPEFSALADAFGDSASGDVRVCNDYDRAPGGQQRRNLRAEPLSTCGIGIKRRNLNASSAYPFPAWNDSNDAYLGQDRLAAPVVHCHRRLLRAPPEAKFSGHTPDRIQR